MKTEYNYTLTLPSNFAALMKNGGFISGIVYTKHGIVQCSSSEQGKFSEVRMMWKGKIRCRTWQKVFTKRGISIMAGKFAKEITVEKKDAP